ncbi:MAG TPA: hypothetical protein VFC07_10290, partial [Verrucomicrobiae bacterium]|nr:hypothetical protein [Verrucomicrobiae bacterium]
MILEQTWLLKKAPGEIHFFSAKHGNYEFQVWQRKNESRLEPFLTAMFVRESSHKVWQAFSLGFQDCYAPRITFRQTGSQVEVFHGRKQLGSFDMAASKYLQVGQIEPINEGTTDSPTNWWISP